MYYGYDYGFEHGGFFAALILVAFIASIVLTVIGYKRYLNDSSSLRFDPRDKSTWGAFLRFDTLIIDKILKVLYLFLAILTALLFAAVAISSLFGGVIAFIFGVIGAVIGLAISEIILRVGYELIMLNVIMARNTSEIKRAVCGGETADADGISSPNPAPAYTTFQAEPAAPAAYTAAPAPQPAVPQPAPDQSAAQPETQQPPVCPSCGAAIVPGSKFCGVCGHKLS